MDMNNINLTQLQHFVIIAELMSVTKASKKLNIVQPALSKQLSELEQDLGVKLFNRKGRGLQLNANGQTVLEYASKIFRLISELRKTLAQESSIPIETLKIAVLPWLSRSHTFEFVSSLLDVSNVFIQLEHGDLQSTIKQLRRGQIDLVLTDFPYLDKSRLFSVRRLIRDRLIVVGTQDFTNFESNYPQSLSGAPLALFSEKCQARHEIDLYFENNSVRPRTIAEIDDTSVARLIAEQGQCMCVLPERVVREAITKKKLYKIGEIRSSEYGLWSIGAKKSVKSQLIRKLYNASKE
jgi:LysR family transcriptional activator of nhaA